MKNVLFIAGLFISISFFACKKKIEVLQSIPVKFTKTSYDSLGKYDSVGRPSYLTTPDTISSNFKSFISAQLPKAVDLTKSHPEYFTSTSNANIDITQKSNVYVTFVLETAQYRNTVGFYTYPSNTPPTSPDNLSKITYIFPSAKFVNYQGGLNAGDKVLIGTFEPGMSIGFVLLRDSWNQKTKTINTNAEHFLSADALNPEVDPSKKKHVVLIPYKPENKTLICFEDQNRSLPDCDNDFSDVIFYSTVTPAK